MSKDIDENLKKKREKEKNIRLRYFNPIYLKRKAEF